MLTDVLGGKPPTAWMFLVSALLIVALAAVAVRMTTGLLQRERIIFGR
jgi:hypothetical protein